MLTERQAELLRRCDCRWHQPLMLLETQELIQLRERRLLAQWHKQFSLTPAGRSALAEFDAAKQQEQ